MIVVRINDRGPYGNDRVISLSRAAADRLNTSNNTKVRIDPIVVAQTVPCRVPAWRVPLWQNKPMPCPRGQT